MISDSITSGPFFKLHQITGHDTGSEGWFTCWETEAPRLGSTFKDYDPTQS